MYQSLNLYRTTVAHLAQRIPRSLQPDRLFISNLALRSLGHLPNLQAPRSFNDKIQWLKCYYRNELLPLCADKYDLRSFVQNRLGTDEHSAPLICCVERASELPQIHVPCIIKATHASGFNHIVDKPHEADWNAIRNKAERWLRTPYFPHGREWCYKAITPRLVAEELLQDEHQHIPMDYKVFCFNGKPHIVQLDQDRYHGHNRILMSTDWRPLSFTLKYPRSRSVPPKPAMLTTLLELAETLSKGLPFVRVDCYLIDRRIYVGEMTFYPGNGRERFQPRAADLLLGSLLRLPSIERLG